MNYMQAIEATQERRKRIEAAAQKVVAEWQNYQWPTDLDDVIEELEIALEQIQ